VGLRNSSSREPNYQQADKVKSMSEAKGEYQSIQAVDKEIKQLKKEMLRAAKELDFILAASIRDQTIMLEKLKETL
jgi:excinuclease ABC subunit B